MVALGLLNAALSTCISLLMFAACGSPRPPIAVSFEQSNALVFQGTLSKAANERIFKLYKNARVKPQLLKISSDGGDINLGMELGDWVFRNHLDVEILDRCFSSCANYVFTAGRVKILNPGSILLWHGGAHQQNLEEQLRQLNITSEEGKVYLDTWRKREDAFFKTIGVDPAITTYGQTAAHIDRSKNTAGYDYSIEDMAKFGITDVTEKKGSWRWRELHPECRWLIVRVEVRSP